MIIGILTVTFLSFLLFILRNLFSRYWHMLVFGISNIAVVWYSGCGWNLLTTTNIVIWYCKKYNFLLAPHKLWLWRRFIKITRISSLLLIMRRNHMNRVVMSLFTWTVKHCYTIQWTLKHASTVHVNSGPWLYCSREQWRHSPLFRPDRVRFKAKNVLNRVRPSKIKKNYF